MNQEYIITDKSKIKAFENISIPKGYNLTNKKLENNKGLYICISVESDDERTAKKLSDIHETIVAQCNPIIIFNGKAAYFNKKLFPLINEFEHLLRKLLYLISILNDDNSAAKNIKNLETQKLGDIFDMLFIDDNFNKNVKALVNKNQKFSLSSIIKGINEIEETIMWDILLGKDCVPSLRNNYEFVRDYRNDVMHAHNMNYEQYNNARNLFKSINAEFIGIINSHKEVKLKEAEEESIYNKFNYYLGKMISDYLAQINTDQFKEATDAIVKAYLRSVSDSFCALDNNLVEKDEIDSEHNGIDDKE